MYRVLHTFLLLTVLFSNAAYAKEKRYQLALSDPSKLMHLNVEVHYGSITVQGYEGKEVEIIINTLPDKKRINTNQEKKPRNAQVADADKNTRSTEGLKRIANNTSQVSIKEQNNRVYIEGERSDQFIELTINLPSSASVNADLYRGGEITITNISGVLELETWKASIMAKNVTGPIVAETYDADIIVEFSQFSEKNPSSLASHSGNIDITLNDKAKAKLNVQNYKGEIYSGLQETFVTEDQIKRNNDRQGQEIIIGSMLSTTVNNGQQSLTLVSYSGDFYIRQ